MSPTTWQPFVPSSVRRRFADGPPEAPAHDPTAAAVLFADVSGFSRLAADLDRRGPAGVEALSDALDAYFGPLVDRLDAHGGEVVRFVGDAPIVLFRAEHGDLADAVARAAACALALQAELDGAVVADDVALRMRVAVTAGTVVEHVVGGADGRWLHVVTGNPLGELGRLLAEVAPGEVAVAAHAAARAAARLVVTPCGDGVVRLVAAPGAPSPRPAPPTGDAAAATVAAFVPAGLVDRMALGGARWAAELRRVTPVFVSLGSEVLDDDRLHAAARALQVAATAEGGLVQAVFADDKGTVAVLGWGLPGASHPDDAARAARAALAVDAALRELGLAPAVGLATGRAFCGAIGGASRRDWTFLGTVVNRAARLMQHAGQTPGPLCDGPTRRAAADRVETDPLPPVVLKGSDAPTEVLRVVAAAAAREDMPLVGRAAERARLAEALVNPPAGRAIVLWGEAGIGKSRLARWAVREARASGLEVLVAEAQAAEAATPYFAWRPVAERLLDVDPARRAATVAAALAARPWLADDAALLAPLLLVDLPETPRTAALTGQARADRLHALVARLLGDGARGAESPTLLLVEDAHWLDSASTELVRAVQREVPGLLVLVTTRPVAAADAPAVAPLVDAAGPDVIRLDALARDEIGVLTAQALGVGQVEPALRDLVHARSGGHPFFAAELALALDDAGAVQRDETGARLADARTAADSVPGTVEAVVAARIDRLPAPEQLTLKAASVVGRTFAHDVLADVHPSPAPSLPHELDHLVATRLTDVERPAPDPAWTFRHAIVQDVAYNQLLFAQRRALHRAVAEWYEARFADNLAPWAALLAHHWERADDRPRAADALQRAAEAALAAFANPEALVAARRARELLGEGGDPARRARLARLVGEASSRLGRIEEGRAELERASAELGRTLPASTGGRIGWLLAAALRQVAHRWLPRWFVRSTGRPDPVTAELLDIWQEIGLIAYWSHDALASVLMIVATVNLGESAGPSAALARAYSSMAVVVGSVPLHGPAERYRLRALALAEAHGGALDRAVCLHNGGVYLLGAARFDEADASLGEAFRGYEELGNTRRACEAALCLAYVAFYRGDLARFDELVGWIARTSERRDDRQTASWAARGRARTPLRHGDVEEAERRLRHARQILVGDDVITQIDLDGELARCRLASGDPDGAAAAARAALAGLGRIPALTFAMLEGIAGAAEVLQALHAEASAARRPDATALGRDARRARRALVAYARTFAFGEPARRLVDAAGHVHAGRPTKAADELRAAMAASDRLGMPWEAARAREALAELVPAEATALRADAARLRATVLAPARGAHAS